jgi:predicted PurR-regulated permease PerM|tara:strand:- start:1419 stop:1781 length:363 start_codon:yes stop_codon:yes gene_type:complete
MTEIKKDELLDLKKWQRFFFMLIYGAAIHFLVGILLFLIAIQFLFYLFTSNTNEQLRSVHNWLQDFFNDALDFLSFNTNSKPWPFKGGEEGSDSSEEEAVDAEEVIEIDAEELDSSDKEA